MNREEAKIIGAMTDEQLYAIGYPEWIGNREFIVAFGEGRVVENLLSYGEWVTSPDMFFSANPSEYRIATSKITFNGVEIDAPVKAGFIEDKTYSGMMNATNSSEG